MTSKSEQTFDLFQTPLLPGVTFDPNIVTAERAEDGSLIGAPGLTDLAVSYGERMTDDAIGQGIACALLVDDHGWRITKPSKPDKDGQFAQSIPVLLGCSDGTASNRVALGRYVVSMGDDVDVIAARAAASFVQTVTKAPKRTEALALAAGVEPDDVKNLPAEALSEALILANETAVEARKAQRKANAPTGPRGAASGGTSVKQTEALDDLSDGPFVDRVYPRWIKVRHENLTVTDHALIIAGIVQHGLDILAAMGMTLAEATALADAEPEPTPSKGRRTAKATA